jgi:penicillin-binding protein 1A
MAQNKPDKNKKVTKKKHTGRKVFKYIMLSLLAVIILGGATAAGICYAWIKTAPPLDVNQILDLNQPSVLYDNKGNFMDNAPTDEKRTIVAYKDIPQNLINAFVDIEDERFYEHKGVDFKRVIGSFYIDVKNKLNKDNSLQGGSTITQQLIKNTLLTSETTMKRKVQEMYLATELEKHLSKDQILEAYLNTIFLGGQAHGVEAAANQYFNKSVKDLSLLECAYIAGVTQSPTQYNALSDKSKKNPTAYINRTKTVLYAMYTTTSTKTKITKAQYDQAISDLNNKKLVFTPATTDTNILKYEWFDRPVLEEVKTDLKAQYHYSDSEINNLIMYGGLKIYTTMDKTLQDGAQAIIDDDKNLGGNSEVVNGLSFRRS